ncbi:type II toxin-antitoxin system RelE/ParE family toxin [Fangia hongkongensis]|uniref:type II toxin-antitoxin system RelE/ParE family toxin n=1 Tax=Fangia hongkongensis TaxID=270495 RepID=UPI0003797AEC|nr:type II toxin-antitoxin system RelE/ParE family toxin [Fangia hongkongensis]MBK2124929.1 type II toxin-antitoxin system RelE/ParE family toxin [Fangia hongkongensis]
MNWTVEFYKGVESDILNLPNKLQAKMLRLFDLVEIHGTNLREPHTKALQDGLFELRAKALEGIARGIFCYANGRKIVVLNVFIKKTQKTPQKEIDLALKRMKDIEHES